MAMKVDEPVTQEPMAAPLGYGRVYVVQSTSKPNTAHMVSAVNQHDGTFRYYCSCPAVGPCRHIAQIRRSYGY